MRCRPGPGPGLGAGRADRADSPDREVAGEQQRPEPSAAAAGGISAASPVEPRLSSQGRKTAAPPTLGRALGWPAVPMQPTTQTVVMSSIARARAQPKTR
jgi:hypothetical protein